MEAKNSPSRIRSEVPAGLADVALIDANACAASGGMSISQWHNLVRDGVAPQPAVRATRFTRWRITDVRGFLVSLAEREQPSGEQAVIDRAIKASAASKAKRQKQASTVTA